MRWLAMFVGKDTSMIKLEMKLNDSLIQANASHTPAEIYDAIDDEGSMQRLPASERGSVQSGSSRLPSPPLIENLGISGF